MKVGFCLFSFIAPLAVCVSLGSVKCDSFNFPNSSLPVCFSGHGSPQSVAQSCVCRWALSGVVVKMQVDQF